MGSGSGQDDFCHCLYMLVCLTGNLEHVIRWVELLSSACVSGIEAGEAIGLHSQNNAALESVCEHMEETMKNKKKFMINYFAIWFLLRWFSRKLSPPGKNAFTE